MKKLKLKIVLRKIEQKASIFFKELYQNAQKLGGGFSRILETLDEPNDLNLLTATGK